MSKTYQEAISEIKTLIASDKDAEFAKASEEITQLRSQITSDYKASLERLGTTIGSNSKTLNEKVGMRKQIMSDEVFDIMTSSGDKYERTMKSTGTVGLLLDTAATMLYICNHFEKNFKTSDFLKKKSLRLAKMLKKCEKQAKF